MTAASQSVVTLTAGDFRTLVWGSGHPTVLLLHGLSGVAEVWGPTVSHLPAGRRYVALDQRGHGQSPRSVDISYSVNSFVTDTAELIATLGGRVHLVGHSMGARVALVLAARHPELLLSAAVVDIGPEASKTNIDQTVRALSSRPERLANRAEALKLAFRDRTPTADAEAIFFARLRPERDGSFTWRSPTEVLAQCVSRQRARNYWQEWRGIDIPALFIHGGASTEVSTAISERMRRENPGVRFERFEGVGHNIPLIAPEKLAKTLEQFWQAAGTKRTS